MPKISHMKARSRTIFRRSLFGVIAVFAAAALVSGCENFFTANLLKSLQRDPSNLSDAQKITYAQSALQSGDASTMQDAFNALTSGKTTSQLTTQEKSLAVQLGIGATGVSSTLTSAFASFSSGGDPTSSLNTAASKIDVSVALQTASIIATLPSDQVTSDDLVLAAAGLILAAGNSAGGVDQLQTTSDPTALSRLNQATALFTQAQAKLQSSGQSSDLVTSLEGLYTP